MRLKIYLEENGGWKLYAGDIQAELDRRNIHIKCEWSRIGDYAYIKNESVINYEASIGERAKILRASIGIRAFIGDFACIGHGASIGDGAIIGGGTIIGKSAYIGDGAIIGGDARIETSYDCIVLTALGSRHASMTAYWHNNTIWIGTGCFLGTIDDFAANVKAVHKGNRHEAEYMAALDYCRAKFSIKI